jgi:dTDP-4-amino-4,6-dideoxygalactose transaminase
VPNLSGNEERYVVEAVRSGFVSSIGPFVGRFEAGLAAAAGGDEAVATCSGTTALHLALTTVGVGRDDLVIVPSLTFVATANAVHHCGAIPWLFDVDAASWTLDPRLLEATLAAETAIERGRCIHAASGRRVAAVLPVYTLGLPAAMREIGEIARRHRLAVVADAAAALGASYRGGPIGRLADLTAFSFNGNKTVTCGGGGALVGGDPELLRRARHLSTTARVGTEYEHDLPGFNYRMTNLEAAVGCAQLERLDALVAAKRAIDAR